jgi:hypothetical protein
MIVKLNENVLKRYEHNLNNGVLFLYNIESEIFWLGNESSYFLVRLLNGHKKLEEIYSELLPLFEGYNPNDIIQSFDNLIDELLEKKFVVQL